MSRSKEEIVEDLNQNKEGHLYFTIDTNYQCVTTLCEHTWEQDSVTPPHWLCLKCGLGKHQLQRPGRSSTS